MKELIAGIDVDGVLRNFAGKVEKTYLENFPEHISLIKKQNTWKLSDCYPIGNKIYNFNIVR